MADVFQLSLFLGIREAQVFAKLVHDEFYKSAQHIFDEAVMPLMISHIATERGVDTSQVELLLVNEAWDRMIADRYSRKWPSADVRHNGLRRQPRSESLPEESTARVGA